MSTKRIFAVLLLLTGLISAQAAVKSAAEATRGFDEFMAAAMKEMQAPGAAVGVLYDGKVVFAKGYGVRELKQNLPVTADTVFAMGSVTKSFTSVTVGTQVDAGKLGWDKPVREYLPWFRMYDPVATELMTARDLLSHRSGLPRYDSMRFLIALPRDELVRRVRYLEPSKTFRQEFQYNNLMFVTAGFLVGQVAGLSWEDLVEQKIFGPLGMKNSSVTVVKMQQGEDFARPHVLREGKPAEVDFYDYQKFGVGPNGAVNSSVNDMLKYLDWNLRGEGAPVLKRETLREIHKPAMVAGSDTYALGWYVDEKKGHKRLSHGGAITGFTSNVQIYPDDKLAIVVLNNRASSLPEVVADELAKRFLGIDGPDPLKAYQQRAVRPRPPLVYVNGTKPSLELAAYEGEYEHPAFGRVKCERQGEGFVLKFSVESLTLRHVHYDTYESSMGLTQFVLGRDGKVEAVEIPVEQAVAPLKFRKVR